MDFVWKLYGNTYAVHVTVALVGVATLNLALQAPPVKFWKFWERPLLNISEYAFKKRKKWYVLVYCRKSIYISYVDNDNSIQNHFVSNY